MVHLNPGVVVVLDGATLKEPGDVSLRWHPVTPCKPDRDGRFTVVGESGTCLASRIVCIGDESLSFSREWHEEIGQSLVEVTLHDSRGWRVRRWQALFRSYASLISRNLPKFIATAWGNIVRSDENSTSRIPRSIHRSLSRSSEK